MPTARAAVRSACDYFGAEADIAEELAAAAAEFAADAALSAALAADEAVAESLDDVDGVLGVTTTVGVDEVEGVGLMVVVDSSFLLQAPRASAATSEAKTIDVFMIYPNI